MNFHMNLNINIAYIIIALFIFALLFTYLEKTIEIENKIAKTVICLCSSFFMTAFTTVLFTFMQFEIPFFNNESLKTTEIENENLNQDMNSQSSNDVNFLDEKASSTQNEAITYIEDLYIIKSDKYTGNEGDSFVYKLGEHKFSRGNVDIYGNEYGHGLEIWIARWNYTNEISWAYSIFKTDSQFSLLRGKIVLINSYNTNNFNTYLYFYDEDELLKKYHLTPDTVPLDIEVNISNVNNLKIYVKDEIAVSGGTSFGLVNCTVE